MKSLLLFLFLIPLSLFAQEEVEQYNNAVKAHNSGDYAKAIECYEKCLKINPNNKDAYANIGIVYYNRSLTAFNNKEYDKCIQYSEKNLSYQPDNSEAYYMIGSTQQIQKKYTEAIASYTQALKINTTSARFYAARAWVYNDLNDNKARLADMKKAVEYEPENATYQFNCGKFKQSISSEEFKTAGKNYTKAIELNPKYMEAYTERAAFYMTFQEFKKALVDLNKAKELGADVAHLVEAARFELEMQEED
jgi:tetratricopeptide (TPR) repeat protein